MRENTSRRRQLPYKDFTSGSLKFTSRIDPKTKASTPVIRLVSCALRLRSLGAIFGSALPPIGHARCIQSTAYGVITNTRQVFDPATAQQYHGVFLQVVTFTSNIGGDFKSIGQPQWVFREILICCYGNQVSIIHISGKSPKMYDFGDFAQIYSHTTPIAPSIMFILYPTM